MPGIHTTVYCKVCSKIMRRINLNRLIEIRDVEAQLLPIRRMENAYKTFRFKRRDVHDFIVFLGRNIYEILEKGKIQINHLTSMQKEALDIYERERIYK